MPTRAELDAALRPRGLRPPFFGPFSGIAATIGGSLSQNSVSWGTGVHGVSADSVLGFEVVLGNGEVLRKMGDAGLLGLMYESQYGGGEADALTNLVFAEALSQSTFGGFIVTVLVHTDMASPHLQGFYLSFSGEKTQSDGGQGGGHLHLSVRRPAGRYRP